MKVNIDTDLSVSEVVYIRFRWFKPTKHCDDPFA